MGKGKARVFLDGRYEREAPFQLAVARLLDLSGLVWQHTPNEGKRGMVAGAILKRQGMKAGFPDVAIYEPVFGEGEVLKWTGVALELKARGNRPTEHQQEWRRRLERCHWRWEVCWTMEEVLAVLRDCYPGRVL